MVAKSTGIVMASVLLSRLLGFWREWAVAHQVGSNTRDRCVLRGVHVAGFFELSGGGGVAERHIYSGIFEIHGGKKRGRRLARIFDCGELHGIGDDRLVIPGKICAGIVFGIVPGFGAAEKEHVVSLTRLMLPAQFCFYMGGILSAVQYAKNRFVVPSLAPLIYNIGIIMCGVLLSSRMGITGFAVGVLVGAIVGNFLLQVYGAKRAGAKFFFSLNIRHPGFILFVKLAVPIMLALSLAFTDDWIIRWFGSHLQAASITWLSYGKNFDARAAGNCGAGDWSGVISGAGANFFQKDSEELSLLNFAAR